MDVCTHVDLRLCMVLSSLSKYLGQKLELKGILKGLLAQKQTVITKISCIYQDIHVIDKGTREIIYLEFRIAGQVLILQLGGNTITVMSQRTLVV